MPQKPPAAALARQRDSAASRRPAGLKPDTRICCLKGQDGWEAPEKGRACRSTRHGHMNLAMADFMVAQEDAEWVEAEQKILQNGEWETRPVWVPVIRRTKKRSWRKTMSVGDGPAVACMQLVP